ncbi:hypothetical protein BDN70DRAFT_810175 [Pholiota conissans]|uniref:DUF6830 domain-containing protein n=1 Tax=Pholiota conissans TaxID=109636 RepID=A0A9P5YXR0_9AGAR|nr:hypothetical protein BDN70DRAFT_810175 [Pholiota conissans]
MRLTGLPSSARVVFHPNVPATKTGGANLLQAMDSDRNAAVRQTHLFFPFANKAEWELASWLCNGGLSQRDIDTFLNLDFVKSAAPSFKSARVLKSYVDSLPPIPAWRYQEIVVPGYPTKTPLFLYWRDGLEIVAHLYANPIFANSLQMTPYRAYDESGQQIFGEYMSGSVAWDQQDRIPNGHVSLGVIGASDKTALTFGTGGKEMHPFLISIANIEAAVRMKASSHAFALAAYLPIPKFRDVTPQVHSILSARLYHFCVNIVVANLKVAAQPETPAIMSNPWGGLDAAHTPLVSWIADNPEQLLISCTSAKHSPISTASSSQFGDDYAHPPRTRQVTLAAIRAACDAVDPWDLLNFYKICQSLHLNGVHEPFWKLWADADPSLFLTPDALHQLHKFFYDHPLKWIIVIMGGDEVDRRLMALQPRVGARHWAHGISTLKQCTGREHRELETLIVAVAAGGVPVRVLCAIRALVDFIFQTQNVYHYDDTLHALEEALREFHFYKDSILRIGARTGKNGPLEHFQIPKLELMQHITRSIRAMGAPYQHTSDITERCHIVLAKRPYRLSNRRDFHAQCCNFLNREEKLRFFQLYTILKDSGAPLLNMMYREAHEMAIHYPESVWISNILPNERRVFSTRGHASLFSKGHSHISADNTTAFLLTQRPHFSHIPVDEAAELFHLPDFRPALGDFFSLLTYTDRGGQRRSPANCALTFTHVNVWKNVRLQQCSSQDERLLVPVQTVQALPPAEGMPYGRAHTVLVDHLGGQRTSQTGDEFVQVRLIFQPVTPQNDGPLLFYGHTFKFISDPQNRSNDPNLLLPAANIDMFLVQRHRRANQSPMGDIFLLSSIRQQVQLVPQFGQQIPRDVNCNNSMEVYDNFYLNNFASKEMFHSILSYQ